MTESTLPGESLISLMSNKVKKHGGINLAQGLPGFAPPGELLEHLKNCLPGNYHQYPPGDGHLLLREFVATTLWPELIPHKSFLITQGATEALSLIYTSLNHMNRGKMPTLSFDPAYESFGKLPGIFQNPCHSFAGLPETDEDFRQLEHLCRLQGIRLIFVASPGNPCGKAWAPAQLTRLIALATRFGIDVVLDLVYHDHYFKQPFCLPDDIKRPNVFIAGSFSKMLSITGWRIGYAGIPAARAAAVKTVHDYTGLCAAHPLQEALSRYLGENGKWRTFVEGIRSRIAANYALAFEKLTTLGFDVAEADGGFFIWARLPSPLTDGFAFATDLYNKEKVALVPGIHFSTRAQSSIRLNLARPEPEISEGLEKITSYFAYSH